MYIHVIRTIASTHLPPTSAQISDHQCTHSPAQTEKTTRHNARNYLRVINKYTISVINVYILSVINVYILSVINVYILSVINSYILSVINTNIIFSICIAIVLRSIGYCSQK